MADFHSLGKYGEEMAEKLLEGKGFRIIEKNWHAGRKEIDIIAENDKFIVFVEVKTRSAGFQVHPREAVSEPKQRTMIFAADTYVRKHMIEKEIRFDIITIIVNDGKLTTDHIEDAFYPTL
jgi:putative endonuclease